MFHKYIVHISFISISFIFVIWSVVTMISVGSSCIVLIQLLFSDLSFISLRGCGVKNKNMFPCDSRRSSRCRYIFRSYDLKTESRLLSVDIKGVHSEINIGTSLSRTLIKYHWSPQWRRAMTWFAYVLMVGYFSGLSSIRSTCAGSSPVQ